MSLSGVSVVIPTYNRAALIPRAVESVFAAMADGDEVIVVDDGSTDDTPRVLESFGSRIRNIRVANGGAGRARNRGVAEATRPLVAFLDSDDEWTPDRLTIGRRILAARPEVLFCFSDFGRRRPDEPIRHGGVRAWSRDERPWDEILGPGLDYASIAEPVPGRDRFKVHIGNLYPSLLNAPYVAVQTLLVRRLEAGAALRFAEDLKTYEDWECVARLARLGQAAYVDAETAWQWSHKGPRLTDANQLVTSICHLKLIERLWGADEAFMADRGDSVRRLVRTLRLREAAGELNLGRIPEARAALAQVADAPLSYRVMASLPSPMARALMRTRREIKRRLTPATPEL